MEAVIGGAFGFAGSALSQMAEGHGFNARKAWGAAANGAIVGAARGALIGSGAGIPLAFGVDFAAGMAGSLAEQKISGARIAPVRAAVDGAFNAAGGRLYGTSPLKNVKNAFMRGALEGAVKGGAYNIADVLDNRLRNAYNARKRQKLRNTGKRNTWNKKNKNPWNSRTPRPTGSRSPQSHCGRPKPLKGMRNPKRRRSSRDRAYYALPNDRFRIRSFVRDVVAGAVMGGLASASFYGAGKAVEALKRGLHRRHIPKQNQLIANEQKPLIELDLQYFAEKEPEESLWKPTSKKWDLWKKGKLNIHFKNHGIPDFGAKSPKDYTEMAYEFGVRRSNDIIQCIYDDAYVYRFEPSTHNIFVGTLKSGRIKTFYKWDGRETDYVIKFFKEIGKLK